MSDVAKCRTSQRRRFQFGLAGLFLAIAVAAFVTWLAVEWRQVAKRNEMREWITAKGGVIVPIDAASKNDDQTKPGAYRVGRIRMLLDDEAIELIIMPRSTSADDLASIQAVFPELSGAIGVFRTPVLLNLHGRSASP